MASPSGTVGEAAADAREQVRRRGERVDQRMRARTLPAFGDAAARARNIAQQTRTMKARAVSSPGEALASPAGPALRQVGGPGKAYRLALSRARRSRPGRAVPKAV